MVRLVHLRSVVAVIILLSYCTEEHTLTAVHTRSLVAVGGTDSYSSPMLQLRMLAHEMLLVKLHADTWYCDGPHAPQGKHTVSLIEEHGLEANVAPKEQFAHV